MSGFSSGFVIRLQSRGLQGLQLSDGLTGAQGFASKIAHSYGCWQKALVPCRVSLSLDCFNVLIIWLLASSQEQVIREREKYNIFYDLVSEV